MTKKYYILAALTVALVLLIVFFMSKKSTVENKQQTQTTEKLRQCPDQWINNAMPSTDPQDTQSQYFILNGQRREVSEFDFDWVKKNCNLKMQTVF